MITPDDLIHLPYTADFSLGGVAYACRSLNHTYDRMGGSPYARLRRIAAGVAVELAFRRHLGEQEVPFDVLGATPYTEPDRYDVAVGGRRCDLKSYLIYRRKKIRRLLRDPEELLGAQALVPSDQMYSAHMRESDLLVFGFLLGLLASGGRRLEDARRAGQPHFLVHTMPGEWARPVGWSSLGGLVLKMDTSRPLRVELGGQGAGREFITERLELEPRVRVEASGDFYSLTYLHVSDLPDGKVGVHSPALGKTYLAGPGAWENIWIYGKEVILAGFLGVREFRRRSRRLPAGSKVLQYPRTQTDNQALPLVDLRPISGLYAMRK